MSINKENFNKKEEEMMIESKKHEGKNENSSSAFSVKSSSLPESRIADENKNIFFGGGGRFNLPNNGSKGQRNTSHGDMALYSNTTGSENVAVGCLALCGNTTGASNLAIGSGAIANNQTGNRNIGIGNDALLFNTTGNGNIAIGGAMTANQTGSGNIGIGSGALNGNRVSNYNIGIGEGSLYSFSNTDIKDVSSGDNIAIGRGSFLALKKGLGNISIGSRSAQEGFEGNQNIIMGYAASIRSGSNNVILGSGAGYSINDEGSVVIGEYAGSGYSSNPCKNQIIIGKQAQGNGSNTITLGNEDIEKLYCKSTVITALSDSRIKEDIHEVDLNRCLDTVKSLPVSRYKYKDYVGKYQDKHVTGFLADDVEKIFPKSVSKQDRYFPVLDENGEEVYEEVTETITEPGENGTLVKKEVVRTVRKMFLLENVKDITMTEALPTLWGAVQALIQEVEQLKKNQNKY